MAKGLGADDGGVSAGRGPLTRQGLVSKDQAVPAALQPAELGLQGGRKLLALKQGLLQGLPLCSGTQRQRV